MKLNWNFQNGWGQTKKPSMVKVHVWVFSGTGGTLT